MSNIPQEKLFSFISGGLIHDTAFAYEVMSKDCEYVKQNCQHIKKLSIFFDNCTSQYKNYKGFMNLCHHYTDFNSKVEWNFFATSHRNLLLMR